MAEFEFERVVRKVRGGGGGGGREVGGEGGVAVAI